MGERCGRSVALERAYVHEVYEQQAARQPGPPWPRVARFIQDLEPGSLVCDVGCGNGKYLNINPSVFTIGGDRCQRLTEIAREKENQVVLCDNLALPFRDESFDAVVSMAVVHHFATAERRARAVRELARILRIGGRLIISVWAMEQRNRKFESQDVLVPWHRPDTLSTPSLDMNSNATTSEDDLMQQPYHAYTQTSDSDSYRGSQSKKKNRSKKGRSVDPTKPVSTSPSTSSLSSPNETCYSFVRRAIQKLAGSKRSVKPWFLESWGSYSKDIPETRYDPDGCEDYDAEIHDLPIELRRLEDEEVPIRRQTFTCSETSTYNELNMAHKSKSLSDILATQQKSMVRSRSSVPSFNGIASENEQDQTDKHEEAQDAQVKPATKPKLVKQKKSINEEDAEEDLDKPTDMKNLVNEMPDFRISAHGMSKRGCVLKQSSLNEELMSTERLREKEKVRKNIQKQASLNEEYLYRRHKKLDSLRDSFFSTSATTAKKFQSLKNGLTHKLKTSTTHIEKATVNSFVRILQGWKSHESTSTHSSNQNHTETAPPNTPPADSKSLSSNSDDSSKPQNERRHSKEDGSDSSKDSSLQSDTSVDSEDSFASVIFIPKSDPNGLQDPLSPTPLSPGPTSPRMKVSSVPTSPRVKNAPGGLPSPRLKQLPLTIFPVVRPPSSPKSTQPPTTQTNKVTTTQANSQKEENDTQLQSKSQPTSPIKNEPSTNEQRQQPVNVQEVDKSNESAPFVIKSDDNYETNTITEEEIASKSKELMEEINKDLEEINKLTAETNTIRSRVLQDTKPYPKITLQTVTELPEIPQYKGKKDEETYLSNESLNSRLMDRKRRERLKQIRDLLRQRPGFVSTNSRTIFPIVRRCSTQEGKVEPVAKPLPRLLSLELFNPETDDMDSDSSGVSSPDSVDSVISVVQDDKKNKAPTKEKEHPTVIPTVICEAEAERPTTKSSSTQSLLEAAAEVAQSLDETCEAVIQSSPRSKRKQLELMESNDTMTIVHVSSGSSSGSNWSLNKLSPGDLRLLEERSRSHSHTSSSGSTSSLERLSPGRRSKERSPKQGSTSNSTWSLNKLSPIKHEGRSFEDGFSKCRRSPTKFPYDSISLSSLESDKSIIKSDSFSRLQANEKLVTCKSDIVLSNEEDEKTWNNECKHHLTEFAEKLSEKLLQEIDQYSKKMSEDDFDFGNSGSKNKTKRNNRSDTKLPQVTLEDLTKKLENVDDPYIHKLSSDIKDLNKLSTEIQEQNKYLASLNESQGGVSRGGETFRKCACKNKNSKLTSIKISEMSDNNVNSDNEVSKRSKLISSKKTDKNSGLNNLDNIINNNVKQNSDVPNRKNCNDNSATRISEQEFVVPMVNVLDSTNGNPEITIISNDPIEDTKDNNRHQSIESGYSLESEMSIDSFSTEKRSSLKVGQSTDSSEVDKMEISPESMTPRSSASTAPLKTGFSVESSSDAGDISGSGSDWSRRDTNSTSKLECGSTASLGCASTASLASCSDWSKDRKVADGRSSSEETAPTRSPLVRQKAEDIGKTNEQRSLQASLSDTSQDSLPSDNGGGAITFHRYYHVFKEGELDQLIEKYVENLHIISSYYDHASWCIIAEKVQVWTI